MARAISVAAATLLRIAQCGSQHTATFQTEMIQHREHGRKALLLFPTCLYKEAGGLHIMVRSSWALRCWVLRVFNATINVRKRKPSRNFVCRQKEPAGEEAQPRFQSLVGLKTKVVHIDAHHSIHIIQP